MGPLKAQPQARTWEQGVYLGSDLGTHGVQSRRRERSKANAGVELSWVYLGAPRAQFKETKELFRICLRIVFPKEGRVEPKLQQALGVEAW